MKRGIMKASQSTAGFLFSSQIADSLLILRDCDRHTRKTGSRHFDSEARMTIADVVYQWLEKLMQADRERARDYEGWKVEQRARRRERKREKLLKGKVVIAQPESIKRKRRVVEIKKVDKAEQKKIYNAQKIFGYVYLMRSDNGFHKIGLSKNIKVRLNGLKSQFPVDIGVIHYFACHDCRKVEKLLHKKYEGKRAQREWFILNESDVRWITSLKDYELD